MAAESMEGEFLGGASQDIVARYVGDTHLGSRTSSEVERPHRARPRFATPFAEILFGAGMLSIALKFASYWDHWVYFPTIPNLLDSVVLAVAGAWLLSRGLRGWHTEVWTTRKTDESALSPTMSVILMVAITVGLAILLYFMVLWSTPDH